MWHKIPGASNYSINRVTHEVRNDKRSRPMKVLEHTGYAQLCLMDDNCKRKTFYLHRILAELFIEKPHGCDVINHKDLNKRNNSESNLEWVTHRGNQMHYWDTANDKRAKSVRQKMEYSLRKMCWDMLQKAKSFTPTERDAFVARISQAVKEY